jgi:diguanylate cyclase (GGDEF)-like protein/PAS domain S-box-containing protein
MPDTTDNIDIRGKIMVVDDDPIVRELARAVLEKAGCTVFECADGESALEEFVRQKPHLLLLDILMPGKSGFEVCSEIRSLPRGSDIPIVIMTGLNNTESLLTAYRLGASDFITKPISWEALPYRIQYILRSDQALRELRSSEKKLANAQNLAKMGNWEWDVKQDKLSLSPSSRQILGVESVESVGTIGSFTDLIHEEDRDSFREALTSLVEYNNSFSLDCRRLDRDGKFRFFHFGAESLRDSAGSLIAIAGTIQDISERKLSEEKIRYLAYYDSLTGLPNRTLFKEHLKRTLDVANQLNEIVAILFIDLDRFKDVNDSMGHDAGDQLLKEVAERIQRYVRKYDTLSRCSDEQDKTVVSRLGGDEFTILLEAIQAPETAAIVAKRVIDILEPPFIINGHELFISASIGISIFPEDGSDVDSLVKHADIAMYSAKLLGQGNYQYFRREMNESSMRRLLVEKHLRRALENEALSIVYQPQIDCENQRLVGLEALIRWNDSELGSIFPDEFVSVAEETGLIITLDRWVINEVVRQLSDWQLKGICPEYVAVNVSLRHFQKKYLADFMNLILALPTEQRGKLGIEITEKRVVEYPEELTGALKELADNGIRISLDDFGTGNSSLDYLTRIPCHTLKIDKSFVARINTDQASMTVITAIIALAKSLNKVVIAEGVETVEQLEFLKNCGCKFVQGFLYQRPLPPEAINNLLLVNCGD